MIDYAISECILGNIDRVVFIISPDDNQLKEHISHISIDKNMPGIGNNEFIDIEFLIVEQKTPLGLGNAIYLAKDYILDDSFGSTTKWITVFRGTVLPSKISEREILSTPKFSKMFILDGCVVAFKRRKLRTQQRTKAG